MNTPLLNTAGACGQRKSAPKAAPILLASLLLIGSSAMSIAQTAPPPSMGEDTKGEPAIIESPISESPMTAESKSAGQTSAATPKESEKAAKVSPLGSATIKESRRENGQVYRIELEHSAGAKQIIEENDSDGSIESTSKDIDDTPNLPKWKLGSW